jgi:hypothetical protein
MESRVSPDRTTYRAGSALCDGEGDGTGVDAAGEDGAGAAAAECVVADGDAAGTRGKPDEHPATAATAAPSRIFRGIISDDTQQQEDDDNEDGQDGKPYKPARTVHFYPPICLTTVNQKMKR